MKDVLLARKDGTNVFAGFTGVVLPEGNMVLVVLTDISKRRSREDVLHRMATEDSLTGLLNRRSFDAIIANAALISGSTEQWAFLILDLNDFKRINDQFGHDIGDKALQFFAAALKGVLRTGDAACRWGGDEFAVLLQPPVQTRDVESVIKRLRSTLQRPLSIGQRSLQIRASVGWSRFPDDGITAGDLYRIADERMFKDKRSHKEAGGQAGSNSEENYRSDRR